MALISPRPFPDGARLPVSRIDLQRVQSINTAVNGSIQVMEQGDPLWIGRFQTEPLVWSRRRLWSAWGRSLREGMDPFMAYDWLASYPIAYGKGVLSLARAVGGAFDGTATLINFTATTIQISGLPANYRASVGDRVSFPWNGSRSYHEVMEAAVGTGFGVITIAVQPPVPDGPAPSPGVAVDLVRAPIVMRLRPGTFSEPDGAGALAVSFEGVQDRTPVYQPEALALRGRMTTLPDGRLDLMDGLIYRLKVVGVWNKLDALWLAAAHDAAAARLNWVADRYNLTAVNSPPFTANRGFKNVSSTGVGYLMTGFTGGGFGDNWQKDSATVGVFSPVDGVNAQRAILGSSHLGLGGGLTDPGSRFMPRYNTVAGGTVNSVTNSALFDSPWTASGSYIATRTDAATTRLYCNGALRRADTVAARQMSLPLYLMAENFGGGANFFSDDTVQAAFVGGGMTGADISAMHAAVGAYLGGVGI